MAVNLESVLAQCNVLLKFADSVTLTQTDREDIISKALVKYSRLRPVKTVSALTGDDTAIYELPSSYEVGFSRIFEIEFPIDNVPIERIDERHWLINETPNGKRLVFEQFNPTAGEAFWLKYTTALSFDSNGDAPVPETDQSAFEFLSVSYMSQALSSHFASKANPNLPEAEIVSFNERVDEYKQKAEDWMKMFKDQIKDEESGIFGNLDFSEDMFFGRDRE